MKSTTVVTVIGACLGALLILTLGDLRVSVQELRNRVDQSEGVLADARAEFSQLRAESNAGIDRALRMLDPKAGEPDPALLQHDILTPSVQVNVKGNVGGGTLLFSRGTHSYVITACHVVQKIIPGHDEETREPVEVTLYDDKGVPADTIDADLVAWDDRKDVALLRLRLVRELPNPAKLATRETLRGIHVFTPIYAVGCPLGHDPLPTLGEIATLNKEVNGERFWMMNAPTIFGNSGGGVFHRQTRELIGVSVMVCTYDGAVSTPVPHLGIMVSLETVYDWLDELHYPFIYDPESSLESFELRPPQTPAASPTDRAESAAPAATSSNR
ncbi:MAG TPA: serine protease [Planctomycetota bacterium]|nr:serine protease [Planctomycetota bacterium]